MSDIVAPERCVGAWIREYDDETLVGCKTCDWLDSKPHDEAIKLWLAHAHDPLFDIRARLRDVEATDRALAVMSVQTYERDVRYLLWVLDQKA